MTDKEVACLTIEVDAGAMKAPAVVARRDRRASFMVDVVGCLCSDGFGLFGESQLEGYTWKGVRQVTFTARKGNFITT